MRTRARAIEGAGAALNGALLSPFFVAPALGQASGGGATSVQSVALWSAALMGGLVVGALALFAIRRRLLGGSGGSEGAPFTLHDLRQLRARGEMTEEEFEAAKAAMLGQAPPGERRAPEGFDLTGEPLPTREPPDPGMGGRRS